MNRIRVSVSVSEAMRDSALAMRDSALEAKEKEGKIRRKISLNL
jgi:hypothetical protein